MTSIKLPVQGIKWITAILVLASALYLPSCSHFEPKTPIVKKESKPPLETFEPAKPGLPYESINLDFPLSEISNPKLYVMKSDRRLLLVQNGVLVRDYLVGLGPCPIGDKLLSGDGRTPEGQFYVCVKNPTSQFYKSLGLSYPDPKHAEKALQEGAISSAVYRTIVQAFERKGKPPWNTAMGGAIMIHGGGGYKDWTKGCIAIRNSAMDELFQVVSVGTPVEVLP